MKIRTQLIITMALFGVMLAVIAASVIVTSRRVDRLNGQEERARRIERQASALSYLANDFLLYREDQQRDRWEGAFSSLSEELASLKSDSPARQAIVEEMNGSRERLQAVFADVASTIAGTPRTPDARDPLTDVQVSWSRLAVQTQGIVFDAERLSQLLHNEIERLRRRQLILIILLLGIFGAYFLVNYLIIYRRTLKSISDLQAGTRIVGSGNLDFAIHAGRTDEIGELSRSFNQMTADLKAVTASKTELEREITEREKAEEELRRQREYLRVTLSSIGDAVVAVDTSGLITFLNPIASALTGWHPEEAHHRPIREVLRTINEQTREPAGDIVGKVLREGCVVKMPNYTALLNRDGREIPIEDSAAPILDASGRITGVVLVFHDVTEKRRAQETLRKSAETLRIVLDFTQDWEYWRSPDHRFLYISPSCERITGYSRDEFLEDPELYTRIIHPEDRERVISHFNEDEERGQPCELEFRILRRDGRERWLGHACQDVIDSQGRSLGRRVSDRDITAYKEAEEALRKSEHRYRTLFESMDEGFALHEIIVDREGRPCDYKFLEVNPAFERQTGLKAADLVGRTLLEVLPGSESLWIERYGRVALTGVPEQFEQWSGELGRWYEVSAFQTEPGRFATVFLDITERKEAEEAIRKAHRELQTHAERLEEVNRELESFSYSVSHDLRSPLRAIDGFTRMILDEKGAQFDAETRRKFGVVQENARKMGALIDDLLRLSRLGRAGLNRSRLDMAGLAREVLAELRTAEPDREFAAEIGDLPPAEGDRAMIRQLFYNLLANAVKFTRGKEGARIEVGSFDGAGERVYHVKDNGVGFDMKYYNKLFGVFQRLVSEREFEGTGVGLAIVHRIVQRHGGRVWAEGKTGEGAAFYFTLSSKDQA